MRFSSLKLTALVLPALPGLLAAQMNFANVYSQSRVDWRSVRTLVDTIDVNTAVNAGQATSVVSMVLRPDYYATCQYISKYDTLIGGYTSRYDCFSTGQRLDSVEMSLSFTLPTDFVVSNLYLWVNGKRETGQIQDRSLADAQYSQITGTRRDPAILDFWGNGSYNLRIFPAASGVARKVAIEFRHTFDDDSAGMITACLPFTYDTTYQPYYYQYQGARSVGFVRMRFQALDGASYSASVAGLGAGSFSSLPMELSGRSIAALGPATISAPDPSAAQEYVWRSSNALPADPRINAGMTVRLDPATIRFDNEPDTRIIALDVRNATWNWKDYGVTYSSYYGYTGYSYQDETVNVWARAQKFAVLALRSYLTPEKKFNVVIGGSSIKTIFGAPVPASEENLLKAFREIMAASPSVSSSTEEVMRAAMFQAPAGATILISDLYTPYNYYANPSKGDYSVSAAGGAYWEVLENVRKLVDSSSMTLFDISDNWDLNSGSVATGGFRIATLLNDYGVTYEYHVVDGRRIPTIKMPPLFGSYNPMGIKVTSLTVTGMSDVVYTNDWAGSYTWWPMTSSPEPMRILAKKSALGKMVLPSESSGESALLRIAGKTDAATSSFPFAIRGKMSGLGFSISGTGAASGAPGFADVQYAFRKSEWLAAQDWQKNALAIKQLGKDYHIVTRQTSLLALEPGMMLWEDTIGVQQQPNGPTGGSAEGVALMTTDAKSYSSVRVGAPASSSTGVGIDDVSLADLMNGTSPVKRPIGSATTRAITVSVVNGGVELGIPATFAQERLSLRLYDAAGRVVARTDLQPSSVNGGRFVWTDARVVSGGFYVVRIQGQTYNQQHRIVLGK